MDNSLIHLLKKTEELLKDFKKIKSNEFPTNSTRSYFVDINDKLLECKNELVILSSTINNRIYPVKK
jgi:hypothetical protein